MRDVPSYCGLSLSPEIVMEIRGLLLRPPEDNPYNVLKQKLIERIADSEQSRLQQLFMVQELGNQKPWLLQC